MRQTSIKSANYTPGDPPADPQQLQRFLRQELATLKAVIDALAEGHMDLVTTPPEKPREGDFRFADGANWNPGGGKGAYIYYDETWNQLG